MTKYQPQLPPHFHTQTLYGDILQQALKDGARLSGITRIEKHPFSPGYDIETREIVMPSGEASEACSRCLRDMGKI